jgi:hypothetical protein
MSTEGIQKEARREGFQDGSVLVTYPDGSMLILESDLAKDAVLGEPCPSNYNDPPPPPHSGKAGTAS